MKFEGRDVGVFACDGCGDAFVSEEHTYTEGTIRCPDCDCGHEHITRADVGAAVSIRLDAVDRRVSALEAWRAKELTPAELRELVGQ